MNRFKYLHGYLKPDIPLMIGDRVRLNPKGLAHITKYYESSVRDLGRTGTIIDERNEVGPNKGILWDGRKNTETFGTEFLERIK